MTANFESKHVRYWSREFTGISRAGGFKWRNVYIFRRITWVNPSTAFVDNMRRRFRYGKSLSYSEKNRCLYLHTQHRVLYYRRPTETGLEYLTQARVLGRLLSGKANKTGMSKSLLPKGYFIDEGLITGGRQ